MAQFIAVSPEEIPNFFEGRRGRVSYPILKSFLETGMTVAKLDRTGMGSTAQSLNMTLGAYIRSHGMPIKLFMRSGEIYLARTDVDPESGELLEVSDAPAPESLEITPEEVRRQLS